MKGEGMKDLIVPKKICKGDTVAFISISGGRAGDPDMLERYETGKKRMQDIFGVKVIETPHALKGSAYLYEHPEKRKPGSRRHGQTRPQERRKTCGLLCC